MEAQTQGDNVLESVHSVSLRTTLSEWRLLVGVRLDWFYRVITISSKRHLYCVSSKTSLNILKRRNSVFCNLENSISRNTTLYLFKVAVVFAETIVCWNVGSYLRRCGRVDA